MRIEDLDIHPLAQAILRYFTVPSAADASELTKEEVLDHLRAYLAILAPAEIQRAGFDVLNVCRFLQGRGQADAAEQVALVVSRAAKAKLVELGGTALLAPTRAPSHERALPPAPQSVPWTKRPRLIESQWESMSDYRRRRLAKLADELTQRTQSPSAEIVPEHD